MHPLWQPVFAKTTPVVEGSLPEAFHDMADEARAALGGSVVAPLPALGIIHVSGTDATDFLHSQVSNAVTDLQAPETRLAAWCSPKGRTLALFRLVPVDDGFLLLLDRDLVPETLKRLRLFVLRSAVTLVDRSDEMAAMGLSGPATPGLLADGIGDPPETADSLARAGDLVIVRLRAPQPRFLVLGPGDAVMAQWPLLAEALEPVGPNAWRLLAIKDGRPDIGAATRDSFVPQMLNLEPLGGISFSKGCYPGQEVVARMHYLGRLKRRLYRLRFPGTALPAPGSDLDHGAGTVVNAATDGESAEVLAVLRIDAASGDAITWDGRAGTLMELPYAMDG